MPASRPPTNALKKIQAIGPKIGTRKISQGTLYGKNPVPASDFLPREPANTIYPAIEILSDELCLAREELSKAAMVSHFFRKRNSNPDSAIPS
jgi:hypothetical protein